MAEAREGPWQGEPKLLATRGLVSLDGVAAVAIVAASILASSSPPSLTEELGGEPEVTTHWRTVITT